VHDSGQRVGRGQPESVVQVQRDRRARRSVAQELLLSVSCPVLAVKAN